MNIIEKLMTHLSESQRCGQDVLGVNSKAFNETII